MKRRNFLSAVAGTTASLPILSNAGHNAQGDVPVPPSVVLGPTGIKTSRLAQGTGMRGSNRASNHTRAGFESLVNLFRHGYDRGVTLFDLADLYGSHVYFREALRFIPREDVTILTKLWWRYDGRDPLQVPGAYQRSSAIKAIERFRHELSTDVLDIVLVHNATATAWNSELAGYIEGLQEAKERGQIRALGYSCHTLEALQQGADLPWVDVVLSRINPEAIKMDASVPEVLKVHRQIRANGKALIGMKIYGEGQLADERERCMKYAQELGTLHAMTIGGESTDHLDENLRLMAKYPAVDFA